MKIKVLFVVLLGVFLVGCNKKMIPLNYYTKTKLGDNLKKAWVQVDRRVDMTYQGDGETFDVDKKGRIVRSVHDTISSFRVEPGTPGGVIMKGKSDSLPVRFDKDQPDQLLTFYPESQDSAAQFYLAVQPTYNYTTVGGWKYDATTGRAIDYQEIDTIDVEITPPYYLKLKDSFGKTRMFEASDIPTLMVSEKQIKKLLREIRKASGYRPGKD